MMDYSLPKTPNKPLKKVVKGLAYTALAAGVALHTLKFVGGLIVLNQIKSGEIEVDITVQDEAVEIRTDEETARHIADKTILYVDNPLKYSVLSGFKLAALAYKANH